MMCCVQPTSIQTIYSLWVSGTQIALPMSSQSTLVFKDVAFNRKKNCPQNASRDGKKSCKNSKSTRHFKFLSLFELSCKLSLLRILQREGKSNPALSACRSQLCLDYTVSVVILPSLIIYSQTLTKASNGLKIRVSAVQIRPCPVDKFLAGKSLWLPVFFYGGRKMGRATDAQQIWIQRCLSSLPCTVNQIIRHSQIKCMCCCKT